MEKSGAMNGFIKKESYSIEDLVEIVRLLRAPDGCPWDREQTHASIRKNLIEETYEVAEAIDQSDALSLREELGDLLLQIVLHSQIEKEACCFDFGDVCSDICHKLIIRHPHVFSDTRADTTEEVLTNWDIIKQSTKGQSTAAQTLESVPKTLPALMRADKVQHRAAKTGFDYTDVQMALAGLRDEIAELEQAMQAGTAAETADELGDVLFSAVNVARKLGFEPEETLGAATDKFCRRFAETERLAGVCGRPLRQSTMDELDELWRQAKESLKKQP